MLQAALHAAVLQATTYHRRGEPHDQQTADKTSTYKAKRKYDNKDNGPAASEDSLKANWERLYKMQNDLAAQVGGFGKLLNDSNLKEKPTLHPPKAPKAGMENAQAQTCSDQTTAIGIFWNSD